jgi:hypothetical protein
MSGAIPPIPQYAFMAWYAKHRDNFNFTKRNYKTLRLIHNIICWK